MNTFRIEGTITTELEEERWMQLFHEWLGLDDFLSTKNELPIFPNGEDLIELSKQETNYDLM